jgi:hypothetical protein
MLTHSKDGKTRTQIVDGVERPSDVAAGERLGHEVRLVARVQLIAKVLDVTLDRAWSNPELLRALLGRQPPGDAFQHLALPIREHYEIFLLPRNVHHAPLVRNPQ